MVDGLSHGHGRGYVLRFGYLLEESTQGDGEIEHDVVDDVEHARDPRAARGGVAGEHQNMNLGHERSFYFLPQPPVGVG